MCSETTFAHTRKSQKNAQDLCGGQVSRVVLEASRRRQDEISSTSRFSIRTQEERCLLTATHVGREDCHDHSPIVDVRCVLPYVLCAALRLVCCLTPCVLPYALWRPFLSSNCLLLCAHFPLTTLGLPWASLRMTAPFFRASRQCTAASCSMKFAKP